MNDRKKPRVSDYIEHIIEAIARIELYVQGCDAHSFVEDNLIQDAVIRNFEIIGEAANNIKIADPAFMQGHPHLKLDQAYKMRNSLAHGYYSINLMTVWNTIKNDLPVLKKQMTDIQAVQPRSMENE